MLVEMKCYLCGATPDEAEIRYIQCARLMLCKDLDECLHRWMAGIIRTH